MLSKRLHTVWVLSCVGWQQCMPALLLLPAYYTESSSIPSPLPCCTPCQQPYKQFELHSWFWKLLKDIGLWQHPRHLQNKTKFTAKDDCSEIFPPRIIPSSNYYMEIHDWTFRSLQQVRKFYPNPKGIPHMGYHLTFLARFRLYHITSCRHFTHIILQLYATMALHSNHQEVR